MYYQLSTGKVINISIEEYLNMTDEQEQYLISMNSGDYATSPWHGSAIRNTSRKSKDEDFYNTKGLDFNPDNDDLKTEQDIDINNITGEDAIDSNI